MRYLVGMAGAMLAIGSLIGAQTASSGADAQKDYTNIPPDPSQLARQLEASGTKLADAITLAEKRIGGKATSAKVEVIDGKLQVWVDVVAPGVTARVQVDAAAGSVAEAPLAGLAGLDKSLIDLVHQAEAKGEGLATSAKVDFVEGKPQIVVEVLSPTRHKQVTLRPGQEPAASMEDLGLSRFPGELVTGEPTKTPSGLMYYVLKPGEGKSPGATDQVVVHYTGWLIDGTTFDSSVKRGRPIQFTLNRVVPGWQEGLLSMKEGGKRKLIIPADLAYGPQGRGTIPPNATLVFDVELLEVVPPPPPPTASTQPELRPTSRPAVQPSNEK